MQSDSLPGSHLFLAKGGEMGERIRSINWSVTTLGPVDSWPQSLRTALSLILNAQLPMLLFWGPELVCFYNDSYRQSLGNVGKPLADPGLQGEVIMAERWALTKPLIKQVLSQGEATSHKDTLLSIPQNGPSEAAYWTFNYSPVIDESGRPDGVLVTCTETIDTSNTVQRLKETRDQLFFAIDAAELGTWDLNPATNRFMGNERLKEWFGLPPNAEIGLPTALSVIADTDRKRVKEAIDMALRPEPGGQYDVVYTIINAQTGQERLVRAKGRAYFDETGTAYRFTGTAQDITEQTLAREQLKHAEQMAQLAVSGAGAGTFFVDLSDDKIVYSPTLAYIFTGSEKTGLTRDLLLTYILPEDRPIREKAYQIAAQTGKLNYEARTVWHDGSIHWLRVVGAYLYDVKGDAIGFSGIAMDITTQRMVQQELERQVQERTKELSNANQTLVRTNHELEQFAYIASHDLQEPLRKIQSFSDLLQQARHDPALFDLYLGKITKSVQRMSALIKAVLEYSRLAAKDDLFRETNLNQILQHVLADFDLLIEQKGAVIESNSLPTLIGIPLQLNQLFTNLIGNALKFTDKKPLITISSTTLTLAEVSQYSDLNPALIYAEIIVKDNGIGFDQQYADRIFSLFQRLSGSKIYDGTGIGLALCKKIIENHGGRVSVESALNQGTTFFIYLPLSRPVEPL